FYETLCKQVAELESIKEIRQTLKEISVCYSEALVRHRNGRFPVLFHTSQCSYRIHVLRNHNTLIMHLVYHIQLAVHHVQYVFPVDDLPHIRAWASQITHDL